MNKLLMISIMLFGLFNLVACDDNDAKKNSHSHAPTVIIPSPSEDDKKDDEVDDGEPTIATCEATALPIDPFIRVQTHYGLLSGQPHISGETGGLLPLTLTNEAVEGDLTLELESSISLVPGQLITYHAQNLDYYVARISSISGNILSLDERSPVVSGIASGQNVWNFYNEATHPNNLGFNAIADYSYRATVSSIEAGSIHVLLGDSWFSLPGFEERIALRYPDATIINKGIGGNTLCNLLARFDTDVPAESPKYVWINSSINDYYQDVTQEEYKLRLQDLISKVQAIGATAIVLDSAPLNNGSTSDGTSYLTLSQRYASQIQNLLDEALLTE